MDTKERAALRNELNSRIDESLVDDVVDAVSLAFDVASEVDHDDIASLLAPPLAQRLGAVLSAAVAEDLEPEIAAKLDERIREEAAALAEEVADAVATAVGASGAAQLVIELEEGNLTVEASSTVAHRLAMRGGDELSRMGVGVRGSAERLSIDVQGNTATITGRGNLYMTAPPEMLVQASTEKGNLYLTGFACDVAARTGKGNIHAREVNGFFDASATRGNVYADGRFDNVTVATEHGNIHVNGEVHGGELKAGTGNVYVKTLVGGDVDCSADDGNVHLVVDRELDLSYDVEGRNLPTMPGGAPGAMGADGEVRIRAGGNVYIKVA